MGGFDARSDSNRTIGLPQPEMARARRCTVGACGVKRSPRRAAQHAEIVGEEIENLREGAGGLSRLWELVAAATAFLSRGGGMPRAADGPEVSLRFRRGIFFPYGVSTSYSRGSSFSKQARMWAYLALLRGTTSGNDRGGTRVQGLSFGVRRLVAAFARRDSSRQTSAPVTSHRRQKAGASSRTPKTTLPVRAPALDGHGKAAPYTGPDDVPRRRPKYAHLALPSSAAGTR